MKDGQRWLIAGDFRGWGSGMEAQRSEIGNGIQPATGPEFEPEIQSLIEIGI